MPNRTCMVDECERPVCARDLCKPHYNRFRRDGTLPLVRPRVSAWDRFWSHVDAEGDCWLWTDYVDPHGYGRFNEARVRYWRVHRYAWHHLVGPIGDGLVLDHMCKVKICLNPDHLRPVTQTENTMAGESFSAKNARKTHCKNGHELTPDNIYKNGKNGRRCKICQKADAKRYRQRQRE